MLRKAGLFCAILALFCIAGGPWAVLQSVAWARMLRDYSQQSGGSLRTAFVQTFDGQHPCELCREIQRGKRPTPERQTPLPTKAEKQVIAQLPEETPLFAQANAGQDQFWMITPAPFYRLHAERPPVPPPRTASLSSAAHRRGAIPAPIFARSTV